MADKLQSKTRWGLSSASLIALGMAIGLGGGTAFAQETEEEIVVTGFRGSLAAALDSKRAEDAAVDVIMAEDIADFPDLNLSESIQRVPGVAITRDAGEGRQIAVRGLGPTFTRVRINGMEALSTTGSTDATGGNNRDRAFDFNVFASELFNSITVRKSASAEVEEGSLGATVDLRTSRPFDYNGFTFAVSGQMQYNDLAESTDPRMAALISNRWESGIGRLGALLSVAYSEREGREEGASTVRWQSGGFVTENTPYTLAQINAAFRPRLPRYDIYTHQQERLGITGALQWAPSNMTEVTLSVLYSNFEGQREEAFLQSNLTSAGGIIVQGAEIQGNSLVYADLDNVLLRSELRQDLLQTEFTQYSLEVEHDFTERLRFRGMAGAAESDHTNPIQTTILLRAGGPGAFINDYTYDFRGDNRLPLITYGTTNLTAPATWGLEEIRLRPQATLNTYETVQGELEFDLNDVFTLQGGLSWRSYEFETSERRRWNGVANNTGNFETNITQGSANTTPVANYSQIISLTGQGLDLPAGLQTSWLVPDIAAAAAAWNLYDETVFPLSILTQLAANRSVGEENRSIFGQVNWNTDLGGIGFRGNFGVRYVETDQTSTGLSIVGGVLTSTTVERAYEDVLPSFNAVFEATPDILFRLGAGRVMSRPGLGTLNPNPVVSVSGSNRTITAGNPMLDPIYATSYDASTEWYFGEGGIFSIAVFHREIESFIQTVRSNAPFTGNPFGLPDSVGINACGGQYTAIPRTCDVVNDPNFLWQYSQPRNTPGGPVGGFEISVQLPLTFLPGPLSNLGVLANYTRVYSDIDYLDASGVVTYTGPLTGQSDQSYNATIYYEDDRFSARVSAAYRSDYPTNLPGRDGNATEGTAETLNVDASARWNVTEHMALTVEGINLTNQANDQYLTPDDRLSFYHVYGRSLFMGFRYTY